MCVKYLFNMKSTKLEVMRHLTLRIFVSLSHCCHLAGLISSTSVHNTYMPLSSYLSSKVFLRVPPDRTTRAREGTLTHQTPRLKWEPPLLRTTRNPLRNQTCPLSSRARPQASQRAIRETRRQSTAQQCAWTRRNLCSAPM